MSKLLSFAGKTLLSLMDERGLNPNSLAIAMKDKKYQVQAFRITTGVTKEPKASTLQPFADFFNKPVEVFMSANPPHTSEVGTLSSNVVQVTHKNGKPATLRKIPLVSFTTGGKWEDVVDNFEPGYAEDWVLVPDNVSAQSFALILRGKSMQPTIPDGATIIVDPHASYQHRSVVIVRQNGDTEATCKRLVYEGNKIFIEPDNSDYGRPELLNDAVIVGVVKQIVAFL